MRSTLRRDGRRIMDALYVALSVLLFGLSWALIELCDRL
jgi:hypothetical protein